MTGMVRSSVVYGNGSLPRSRGTCGLVTEWAPDVDIGVGALPLACA